MAGERRDTSFVPDLGAWDPWSPDEVAAALDSVQVRWAVAGGWALDLHLGESTRPHADIEIVAPCGDVHVLRAFLVDLEWFAVGGGRAWPIADAPQEVRQSWGRDRSGRWRLDVIRETWEAGEWVYHRDPRIRRSLTDAIQFSPGGIPHLAPEIVLLLKAKEPRDKDEADLASTLPSLTPDRITWLRSALEKAHPGHRWTPRLPAHGEPTVRAALERVLS